MERREKGHTPQQYKFQNDRNKRSKPTLRMHGNLLLLSSSKGCAAPQCIMRIIRKGRFDTIRKIPNFNTERETENKVAMTNTCGIEAHYKDERKCAIAQKEQMKCSTPMQNKN